MVLITWRTFRVDVYECGMVEDITVVCHIHDSTKTYWIHSAGRISATVDNRHTITGIGSKRHAQLIWSLLKKFETEPRVERSNVIDIEQRR